MKSWSILLLIVFIAAFLAFLFNDHSPFQNKKTSLVTAQATDTNTVTHISKPFDTSFYDQAYQLASTYRKDSPPQVMGGIIPHHLLVPPLIAAFFEGLPKQKIKTVILIGPNHYNMDDANITTSKGVWKTVYGDLDPNNELVDKLVESKTVVVNEATFDTEHSIFGITTFIKRSLPNAKIVPIIFKSYVSKEEGNKLAEVINQNIDNETIVVASVDFSHYLSSTQADAFDEQSIEAIKSFNLDKVFSLDGTKNFDSPPSLYTLLKIMQLKNATTSIVLQHTNSAKYTNELNIRETTSYFTIYFTHNDTTTKLDLDRIFSSTHDLSDLPKDNLRTVIATGDVIPARSVNFQVLKHKDFTWPYLKTADITKNADITFVNLETPLISKCNPTQEGMIFCGHSRNIEGLIYTGVDIASLANNHAGNYGIPGVLETVNLLNENNILVTGVNDEPVIKNVRGVKFAFLGYNDVTKPQPGVSNVDEEKIRQEIAQAKQQADVVIVTYHWGAEYKDQPDNRQKYLGHFTIDAGADLVIGNHPHWVQPIEIYKGKLITYAHGNFVFDQEWSQKTKEGVIGKYIFYDNQLVDVEYLPVQIDNYGQPSFSSGDKKKSILESMKNGSLQLSALASK